MHSVWGTLTEFVHEGSEFGTKLRTVVEWAETQYSQHPTGTDGQVRGLDHCHHCAQNTLQLMSVAQINALEPVERFALAAGLVIHDVGRDTCPSDHGLESARRFISSQERLELTPAEAELVADIVSIHHYSGETLKAKIGSLGQPTPLAPVTEAIRRRRGLALWLKLADLLDTTHTRADINSDPALVAGRRERIVRLARARTMRWEMADDGRTIVVTATPRTLTEQYAAASYQKRLKAGEFDPISEVMEQYGLPHRMVVLVRTDYVAPSAPFGQTATSSPGLYWFSPTQTAIFHGRDDLIEEVCTCVDRATPPLIRLLGVSGAGKSSLIAGGIIPRLTACGWQAVHLRPDLTNAGDLGWRAMAEGGGPPQALSSIIASLRAAHMGDLTRLGGLVALDQLEDMLTPGRWEPDRLRAELSELLAESHWLTTIVAYRGDYETTFGPLLVELWHPGAPPDPVYVQMLNERDALVAFSSAPELSDVGFRPGDLPRRLVSLLADETYREFNGFGVYPPYVQMLISGVLEASPDRMFSTEAYDQLTRRGAKALVGRFLHSRLNELPDPRAAQLALWAVVDVSDGGRKGRATVTDVAAWLGTPLEHAAALLTGLEVLRLLRCIGDGEYEIAHDYLAGIIAAEMPEDELQARELADMFRRKARNYGTTAGDPLTPEQLAGLFRMRGRLGNDLSSLERQAVMLSRWSHTRVFWERQEADDGGVGPGWWAVRSLGRQDILVLLSNGLTDGSSQVKRRAENALRRLLQPQDLPLLRDALGQRDSGMYVLAATVVAELGGREDLPWLWQGLQDPDRHVRSSAADGIRRLVGREDLPSLRGMMEAQHTPREGKVANAVIPRLLRSSDQSWLAKTLEDTDWRVRRVAADCIVKLGSSEGLPALRKALGDPQWQVRQTAIGGIAQLGSDDDVLRLVDSLKDLKSCVRLAAVEAIIKLANDKALHWLRMTLIDNDWRVRRAGVAGIGRFGDEKHALWLKELLSDTDWHVRECALVTIAELGNSEPLPLLRERLQDPHVSVVEAAIDCVCRLGGSHDLLWSREALRGPDASMRRVAVKLLGRLGSGEDLSQVRDALRDPDSGVRQAAVQSIAALGGEWRLWLDDALKDPDRRVRQVAVERVGALAGRDALPWLRQAFRDQDRRVRQVATDALVGLLHREDSTWWREVLKDPEQHVRRCAAKAVAELARRDDLPWLREALRDPIGYVGRAAGDALVRLVQEDDLTWLRDAFGARDRYTREVAVEAAGRLGDRECVSLLRDAAQDGDERVSGLATRMLDGLVRSDDLPWLREAFADAGSSLRRVAADALGRWGSKDDLPGLRKALDDPDKGVAMGAAVAMCRLADYDELEQVLLGGSLGTDVDVLTVFDWHLYAPEFVKEAHWAGESDLLDLWE